MRCRDLIEKLERLCPHTFAESWDNVGLLAGRYDREIGTVLVALDVTDAVVAEAVSKGADLVLSHHPLIFSAKKSVTDGDFTGRRLVELLRNDVCCYAMHTNFDVKVMAEAAAERLGLEARGVLDITYEDGNVQEGIGRYGKLPQAMTLRACGAFVKQCFGLEWVKLFGDGEQLVERAAVCPGSGKSVIGKAARLGAQVLITGDIGHHEGIDALAQGLSVIDAGHYGLEKLFVPYMEQYLGRECAGLRILRAGEKNPFWIL